MITVTLYTGQVLRFPDGTPEAAIRRAAEQVLSGEADRKRQSAAPSPREIAEGAKPAVPQRDGGISTEKTITVEADGRHYVIPSIVDGKSYMPEAAVNLFRSGRNAPIADFDTAVEAQFFAEQRSRDLDRAFGGPGALHKGPSDPASGVLYQGAGSGSLDLSHVRSGIRPAADLSRLRFQSALSAQDPRALARARELRLLDAERGGPEQMARFGFLDRGMHYENPETGERVLKRRRVGQLPGPLDPGYRPKTAGDRLHDAYEIEGRGVSTPEERAVTKEFVRGIPSRVVDSMAGMLLPVQALEAGIRGYGEEAKESAQALRTGRRSTGEGFARGAAKGFAEGELATGIGAVRRDLVDPDRERLIEAAVAAGMSPEAAASLDTAQLLAGEALNPGNYVGVEAFRVGGRGTKGGAAAARASALESRGGARALEDGSGLVVQEFGSKSASSEIAQARAARSGEFRPGSRTSLLDYDPARSTPWQGQVPDLLRRATGRPWRTYPDREARQWPMPRLPLERPTSPEPRPRSVSRAPVEVPIVGGSASENERIRALWDYISRRYPKISSTVKRVEIVEPKSFSGVPNPAFFRPANSVIQLRPDDDLGVLVHELTHAAQAARRRPVLNRDRLQEMESFAIRNQEVYSRVPEPVSRPSQVPWDWDNPVVVAPREQFKAIRARLAPLGEWQPQLIPADEAVGPALKEAGNTGKVVFRYRGRSVEFDDVDQAAYSIATEMDLPPEAKKAVDTVIEGAVDSQLASRRGSGYVARSARSADLTPRAPDADFEDWLDREGWQSDVLAPGQRVKLREQFNRETDPRYAADAAESEARIAAQQAERARLLAQEAEPEPGAPSRDPLEPDRLYAPPRPGSQPPVPAPQLPDEIVAERIGWKHPTLHPGSPAVAGPPIHIDEPGMRFQTNLAAQLGGDEQVANYIVQESDAVFRAIGPPQTWDTLEEMASRLRTSKEQFLTESSHWNVLAPEARLRLLYVIKGNEAKISGIQGKLVAGAATDAEKAELLRLIETRGDLIRLGVKSGSAYGRALNSLRMEARLSLGDDQLLRQQLYKKYSKQLDAERPLLDALARLDPMNQNELQTFLRAVDRPKFREYVQEFWVSSILSGPASHERNLIGNAVNALVENAVIRPLAGVWDAARVAGTGAEREVFLRETPRALIGLTLGIRQGVRRGIRVLKTGYDPDSMQGKLFPVRSAFARSQNRVVREVVGPVVTMPLRLLAASDALFKTMNWNAEIYAQAARIAAKKKIKVSAASPTSGNTMTVSRALNHQEFAAEAARLVANPTDEMIDAADNFALKATFNDPASAFGSAIINLRDLPNIQPESKVGRFGLDSYRTIAGFAIPFVKIADRLMVRGFEYTPIGALKAIGARQAGNLAESADLAARASFGSVILAYAASLAMEGRLTAGAPTDEAEKAAFYGANKQAWSVRTEDGRWIPYGGLQPIGTPFALAAAAWKGWTEHGEDPDVEKLGHAAAEIGVYLTDQSYMDGLSKFMDAIAGSEMERGRAFSDFATNTTWGFAPYSGLTRTIAKGIDPRVIDAQSIPDKLRQNVPGTSLGMQARLTPWGEDVVPVGGRLRSVLAPGSVLLPSREKPNALDEELARLGMPLGYVGKTISDRLGSGKSRGPWKLSQEEWYVYQQTAGRMTKRTLTQLFSKPGYATWDIEKQREETEKAIGAAREYARIQVVRYHRGFGPPGLNPR